MNNLGFPPSMLYPRISDSITSLITHRRVHVTATIARRYSILYHKKKVSHIMIYYMDNTRPSEESASVACLLSPSKSQIISLQNHPWISWSLFKHQCITLIHLGWHFKVYLSQIKSLKIKEMIPSKSWLVSDIYKTVGNSNTATSLNCSTKHKEYLGQL